jgi:hypothetical protein
MTGLVPKLKKVVVDVQKLVLDPNNPRLITSDDQLKNEEDAVDLKADTTLRMDSADHDIDELVKSIKSNGWIPIDYIFVKSMTDGRFLVLEGNRRVTALTKILREEDDGKFDRASIENIEVMQVEDDDDGVPLKGKITYLLGVRHHGSLKKWSPFARAFNIYQRYLELANQNDENFNWEENNPSIGVIADSLTISEKEVRERIKVFCAMNQIGQLPSIKASEPKGGMKGHYYSLCEEVLLKAKKLSSYIIQDPCTFLLDEMSLERMRNLCNFEKPGREDAAINRPEEWRKLGQILDDDDEEKRKKNLNRVEVGHEYPSDVWAERAVELHKLEWDKWLKQVTEVLRRVQFGDDLDSKEAKSVATEIRDLAKALSEADK